MHMISTMMKVPVVTIALLFLLSFVTSEAFSPPKTAINRSTALPTSLPGFESSDSEHELQQFEQILKDMLDSAGSAGVAGSGLYARIAKECYNNKHEVVPAFKSKHGMRFIDWLESLPETALIAKNALKNGERYRVFPATTSSKTANQKRLMGALIKSPTAVKPRSMTIRAKTANQGRLMEALNSTTSYVIVEGPAGTGKTSLICFYVAKLIKKQLLDRIIVTRPTVTAGEELGFLPGSLKTKLCPYLMPIYDCFREAGLDVDQMLFDGSIEVAPLAFMRGRTFKNSFIIADEMQNATPKQLKMLLTRLGYDSRMAITGDINQSDLQEKDGRSGLHEIIRKAEALEGSEYMKVIRFNRSDVCRHEAVKWMLENIYEDMK